jgi:hypothetical protein
MLHGLNNSPDSERGKATSNGIRSCCCNTTRWCCYDCCWSRKYLVQTFLIIGHITF